MLLVCGDLENAVRRGVDYKITRADMLVAVILYDFSAGIRLVTQNSSAGLL